MSGSENNLVANFKFNENYGLSTVSANNGRTYTGSWYPIVKVDKVKGSAISASAQWMASQAPLDNHMVTNENVSVIIPLNGTDPLGEALEYTILGVPNHGKLYSVDDVTSATTAFYPKLGDELSISNSLVHGSALVYVPSEEYSGDDYFSYGVVTQTSSRASELANAATVRVQMMPQDLAPQLIFDDASLVLDTFGIVDDAWESSTPLSVTLQIKSDEVTAATSALEAHNGTLSEINADSSELPVRFSLASTRGLMFSEHGAQGDGVSDVVSSFKADEYDSSEAISRLTIDIKEPIVNTDFAN